MGKNKYENFTLSLALFDAIPVICFSVSAIAIAINFKSTVFIIGAIMCAVAGCFKVSWKITIAKTKKDIKLINNLSRILMPIGFILVILGLIFSIKSGKYNSFFKELVTVPSLIFVVITCVSMVMMCIFAFTLDSSKAKSNWIEQSTNALAQISFLLAIIIAL